MNSFQIQKLKNTLNPSFLKEIKKSSRNSSSNLKYQSTISIPEEMTKIELNKQNSTLFQMTKRQCEKIVLINDTIKTLKNEQQKKDKTITTMLDNFKNTRFSIKKQRDSCLSSYRNSEKNVKIDNLFQNFNMYSETPLINEACNKKKELEVLKKYYQNCIEKIKNRQNLIEKQKILRFQINEKKRGSVLFITENTTERDNYSIDSKKNFKVTAEMLKKYPKFELFIVKKKKKHSKEESISRRLPNQIFPNIVEIKKEKKEISPIRKTTKIDPEQVNDLKEKLKYVSKSTERYRVFQNNNIVSRKEHLFNNKFIVNNKNNSEEKKKYHSEDKKKRTTMVMQKKITQKKLGYILEDSETIKNRIEARENKSPKMKQSKIFDQDFNTMFSNFLKRDTKKNIFSRHVESQKSFSLSILQNKIANENNNKISESSKSSKSSKSKKKSISTNSDFSTESINNNNKNNNVFERLAEKAKKIFEKYEFTNKKVNEFKKFNLKRFYGFYKKVQKLYDKNEKDFDNRKKIFEFFKTLDDDLRKCNEQLNEFNEQLHKELLHDLKAES